MYKKKLVDTNLVHKSEIEDVLIYEPNIVLINKIAENDFNDLILRNPEQEHLFRSIYKQCKYKDQYVYILRTLPLEIAKDVACTLFSDIQLSEFYEKSNDETLELIGSFMPLHLEDIIRSRLLPDIPSISDDDKKTISALQSTATVYSYLLFNDTKNQYFYKKNHEHVPGMMLIEAARQAVYDYVYSLSGHVFKDVSISISSLHVDFLSYTVSSYPVELLFSHKDYVRRYKPKTIEKKAWFYQRGKLTGTFCLIGGIIPMSIFSRLRNENYSKTHDFYPFDKDTSLKVLSDNGKELIKKIVSLTLKGVIIEDYENDITNISSVILQDKYEFSIKQSEVKEANNNLHHLIFKDLSKSQLLTLNNMINTSFFHRPMFAALDI